MGVGLEVLSEGGLIRLVADSESLGRVQSSRAAAELRCQVPKNRGARISSTEPVRRRVVGNRRGLENAVRSSIPAT